MLSLRCYVSRASVETCKLQQSLRKNVSRSTEMTRHDCFCRIRRFISFFEMLTFFENSVGMIKSRKDTLAEI